MILRSANTGSQRPGVSLLEVIISVSIFLISIAALGQLIDLSVDSAKIVEQRSLGMQVCQSKMNEAAAGVVPLISTQGDTLIEGEDVPEGYGDWQWDMIAEEMADYGQGLWKVTITVTWPRREGDRGEVSLTQMVLDPAVRGTTADAANITGSDDETGAADPATQTNGTTPQTGGTGN